MVGPARFDPSSPGSIAGASFSTVRKGFAPDEVRAALTSVSVEIERLSERNRQLEAELAHARREGASSIDLDEAALTERIGEETVRVLQTARESANQIKSRAEENAARLVAEATEEVSRVRHDADLEVSRKRADAAADAEAELALAKQQGREMVNEARAYRERVLADLETRTARARQQLEELAHGRERLLQVFERARLVAIDVSTELGKHPGPDELVNLANVTGPVPVMVPNRDAPAAPAKPDVGIDQRTIAELAEPEPESAADSSGPEPDATADAAEPEPTPAPADDATEPESVTAEPTPEAAAGTVEPEPASDPASDPAKPGADTAASTEAGDPAAEQQPTGASTVADAPLVAEPLDTAPTNTGSDPTEPATQPAQPDNVVALFARLRQEASQPEPTAEREPVAPVAVLRGQAAAEPAREPVAEPGDEAVDTPFTRRDEALVPLIVTAARKLKRVLADEQNGVLDVLRGRQPVNSLSALLPNVDEHAATYVAAIVDELTAAAEAGASETGGKLAKGATGALAAAQAQVADQLVAGLRDRLDRSVASGSGDNTDVTRGVRNVYREWKTQHIDEQLDDVFRAAFAGGADAAVAAGTPVVWLVEPGETCCADCADNTLAGAMPAGSEFPTGHTSAPAHPGCRCLVLPV